MNQQIDDLLKGLATSLKANDQQAGLDPAMQLLSITLNNIDRIANALEKLASPPAKDG